MDELMHHLKKINSIEEIESSDEESKDFDDWNVLSYSTSIKDKSNNHLIVSLSKLMLEKSIFDNTIKIFNKTVNANATKRLRFKEAIMCASIWCAFSTQNKTVDEKYLMEYFKTNKTKYTKALKLVKIHSIETRAYRNSINNELFLICKKLNIIEDDISHIKSFIQLHITNISLDFKVSEKQMYLALLYMWLLLNKKRVINFKTFVEICVISNSFVLKRIIIQNKNILKDFVFEIIDKKTKLFSEKFCFLISEADKLEILTTTVKSL